MSVRKSKPTQTPRMLEDSGAILRQRSDELVKNTAVTVRETRKLILQSQEIIARIRRLA